MIRTRSAFALLPSKTPIFKVQFSTIKVVSRRSINTNVEKTSAGVKKNGSNDVVDQSRSKASGRSAASGTGKVDSSGEPWYRKFSSNVSHIGFALLSTMLAVQMVTYKRERDFYRAEFTTLKEEKIDAKQIIDSLRENVFNMNWAEELVNEPRFKTGSPAQRAKQIKTAAVTAIDNSALLMQDEK